MAHKKIAGLIAGFLATGLVLSGCSNTTTSETTTQAAEAATVTVDTDNGPVEVPVNPESVVSLDNRTFETLSDWGVKLKAAPRELMPHTISYKDDESIVDIGNHREPNLEAIVAANPDLIIQGQRFSKYADDLKELAGDAAFVDLNVREGQPLDSELKRQTTELGKIFDKSKEAEALNTQLDDAVEKVKAAYKPEEKVLAVNVSGGKIGFIAPEKGRAIGPLYPILGLTPALQVENSSDNHKGDEISVEAIVAANPQWILVLDRDAAIDDNATPAKEVLENNDALKNVDAVKNGHVVYMPADTYTNESIQTYIEFLNELASKL
ncbi:siderophore ABC transporter substrate-binding protein [Corynebacterium glucuronolyticum]|uniref:Siderophore ABC transporter substrate-binding protein n=2 Tax=Corynebacterium glucuronolyticum TaxID=39791 RepID=A0A7T4EF91_9CORY|nr:siderophore ABC transporter substrate-binding protein [Corynebacterium glucuronolyticum]QQB46242.1 siderophore ABC transporter substrate-binding protein [Corynebacterium glucuronolyticum]QQU87810.1 siderophore ABC transporter substrate-binding protein [Corynebacterium glucuronolyticum]QRO81524.1 siderophore ABC transporter substrate-binding protein [Corynebacterium glucuronolyticum]WKD62999.1 putative ABC transporter solute-binding protein YclQ precursor [Corynebacterium glucuronolyticum DSM